MANFNQPKVTLHAKAGVTGGITNDARARWNPDLVASVNASDDEAARSISILDPIGADFWGEGVTAKRIAAALRGMNGADVIVNINSPGGDVFEGLAIYNLLREYSGNVTVRILGLAASAASIIAMAANEIQIGRAAFLMVHNTWVVAQGDRYAFREVADWLEPFDGVLADVYVARTGKDKAEIADMLDRETWISGQSAVDQGFADMLLSSDEIDQADAKNMADLSPLAAAKKLELLLAGVASRNERRALVAALKGGTQNAAQIEGTPGAAITDLTASLKAAQDLLKTI